MDLCDESGLVCERTQSSLKLLLRMGWHILQAMALSAFVVGEKPLSHTIECPRVTTRRISCVLNTLSMEL